MTDRLRQFSPEITAKLTDMEPELFVSYLLHLNKEDFTVRLCDPNYMCDLENLVTDTDATLKLYYGVSRSEIDAVNYLFLTYYQTHLKNNGHQP